MESLILFFWEPGHADAGEVVDVLLKRKNYEDLFLAIYNVIFFAKNATPHQDEVVPAGLCLSCPYPRNFLNQKLITLSIRRNEDLNCKPLGSFKSIPQV